MPIYAYRCDACGHAKDVLQKLSDPVLSTCPACGAGEFRKQLTAAGFQLKGSGWYVTDFKGGAAGAKGADAATAAKSDAADAKPADAKAAESKSDGKSDGAAPSGGSDSGGSTPTAAAAGGGCGGGCACH